MIRRPPSSTRTDTLFPYTTHFRSFVIGCHWIIEDGTASGVAAEKCALRPFQHLHRIEVVGGDAACQVGAGHIREIADDRRCAVSCLGLRLYADLKDGVNARRGSHEKDRKSTRLNSSH